MTVAIILILCLLVLVAYAFDITASFTKIPSVILLLVLGWIVRRLAVFYEWQVPDLRIILPVLGTIGLILIVLEGALELELNRSKLPLVKRSLFVAFLPMVAFSLIAAPVISYVTGYSFLLSLTNIIPFAVISSAIAIPSVKYFAPYERSFVVYESSLSDILGVILFNFVIYNTNFDLGSIGIFLLQILVIVAVSFFATLLLSFLLSRIEHEIKFIPILFLTILIYEISKIFHLPSLLFILVFGLFLGNLDELKHIRWIQKLKPQALNREAHKFLAFIMEITFLIRALFFILFGFLIDTKALMNINSLVWSLSICALIFLLRAIVLKLARLPLRPLVFIAPRGLITILLFLSLPMSVSIPMINNSIVIQVIVITALVMMAGSMLQQKEKPAQKQVDEAI